MKYKVNFTYDMTGYMFVEAQNDEDAKEIVMETLGSSGALIEGLEYEKDYAETEREFNVQDCEIVERE